MIFLRNLAILSAGVLLLIFLLLQINPSVINPYVWYILGYFIIITIVTHFISSRGIKSDLTELQNYYMGATTIRLLLSAVIIFLYVYYVPQGKGTFIFNFFALYLFYTAFEIKTLLANLRAHLKNERKQDA
jgi:Na+/proline symporter